MTNAELKLRSLSFEDESGKSFTAFVAMNDDQFEEFRKQNKKNLEPNDRYVVHMVEGIATERDIESAKTAYRQRFGSQNIYKHTL